ncbi:DUF3114 domain-containing protein [Loigolactobacillus zhaoyuanensis]|uniref:DUF3114 domain-containing protein n=1 Tax=Loigolactobacillus zhaoyuanensis TaxID=2486017 RepID=A0ABW8UAV8_9LACO
MGLKWNLSENTVAAAGLLEKGWPDASIQAYAQYIEQQMEKELADDPKWSHTAAIAVMTRSTDLVGSGIFQAMWQADKIGAGDVSHGQRKLALLMKIAGMVGYEHGLDGTRQQTNALLKNFGNIAPQSRFWANLARTVQIAFPKGLEAAENQELARQVHQYRYVIAAQQIRYVRDNYSAAGQLDDQAALIKYLRTLDKAQFSLAESARLHQKIDQAGNYPSDYKYANLKITVGFNSEFILAGNGHLINEIDYLNEPEQNINGLVNGASFNYAAFNDYRPATKQLSAHYKLDMRVGKLDPDFRTAVLAQYYPPKDTATYKDNTNEYAVNDQSAYDRVKAYKREIATKLKAGSKKKYLKIAIIMIILFSLIGLAVKKHVDKQNELTQMQDLIAQHIVKRYAEVNKITFKKLTYNDATGSVGVFFTLNDSSTVYRYVYTSRADYGEAGKNGDLIENKFKSKSNSAASASAGQNKIKIIYIQQ